MEKLLQTLRDRYSALRDQAEAEQGKGSADSIAYWNSVESLNEPEPRVALEGRIRGSATLTVTSRKVLGMEYKNRTDK